MNQKKRKGPRALGELTGRIVAPVAAKRGFATADLIAAWPDIAGDHVGAVSQPEKIAWSPRDPDEPGVLVLRVDGPSAVLIQHELDQIVEKVNDFMGYQAVARIRLVQGRIGSRRTPPEAAPVRDPERQRAIDEALAGLGDESDELTRALRQLGRGVVNG